MAKDNKNINTKNTAGDIESDAFMNQLMTSLQESAGAVSSFDTEIESGISKAMKGIERATAAGTKRIESSFERQKTYAADLGSAQATTANEARRGFATNTGILKQIYQDTDKNLKDLEGASKIAELQLKEMEFKQEAAQRAYSNMLSMANFGLSAKQEARQQRAQTFQEKQALGAIALQYGLKVEAGDDIDSMLNKAAPFASERQKLELAKMRQEITESQARIADMVSSRSAENATISDYETFAEDALINGQNAMIYNFDLKPDEATTFMKTLDRLKTNRQKELMQAAGSYTNKSKFEEDMKATGKYTPDMIAIAKSNVKGKPVNWSGWGQKVQSSVAPTLKSSTTIGVGGTGFDVAGWLQSFGKK